MMADKHAMLGTVFAAFACVLDAASAAVSVTATTLAAQVQADYQRVEDAMSSDREASIANLTGQMTLDAAFRLLHKDPKVTPQMFSLIESSVQGTQQRGSLRARAPSSLAQRKSQPTGYSGVDSARNMLNSMLDEVNRKYDMENSRCSEFFKAQCALMASARQDISFANSQSAKFRGKVLGCQAEINTCEKELPRLRYELASSIHECKERTDDLEAALKIVLADIQVMTNVLQMTDCSNQSSTSLLLQLRGFHIVKCKDRCHKDKTFLSFDHADLRKLLARLQPQTREHIQALLSELAEQDPVQGQLKTVLLQDLSSPGPQEVYANLTANITNFTNPPLQPEPVPGNPCEGITFDNGLGKGQCSVSSNPQCYKIQGKFLAIQTGIVDKRDELLASLARARESCKQTQEVLNEEIQRYDGKHKDQQAQLADSTEGETTAAEEGRMKGKEHSGMETAMFLTREDCSRNMRTMESEMCSLKKIRGELYKMRGDGHPAFFQDCEVSEWEIEKCSVSCGGGTQKMTRSVVANPVGGMQCPPLEAFRSCNSHKCPIDCKLSAWGGWSACSSECGGGVSQRVRDVLVQPRYDGEPCDDSSETRTCNLQSCDVDCVLEEWSEWTSCSKECDTGHIERRRVVLEAAIGAGKCPEERSKDRLEEEKCNTEKCEPLDPTQPIRCQSKVDVVLVLDGSGSIGQAGWDATKGFAHTFVRAFEGAGTDAMISVILFSGPHTYSEYETCIEGGSDGEMPAVCNVRMIQHLSNDTTATKAAIAGLAWPTGTTLTRVALQMAKSELKLSRPDAQAVVLVVSDGLPLSPAMTATAAKELRELARLMWTPVNLNQDGVEAMRSWASLPVVENMVNIGSFEQLHTLQTIDQIVANICPKVEQLPKNYTDEALTGMYEAPPASVARPAPP